MIVAIPPPVVIRTHWGDGIAVNVHRGTAIRPTDGESSRRLQSRAVVVSVADVGIVASAAGETAQNAIADASYRETIDFHRGTCTVLDIDHDEHYYAVYLASRGTMK